VFTEEGVTVIDFKVALVTLMVMLPAIMSEVAVMVAVEPAGLMPTAVTTPAAETVATEGLLELQTTPLGEAVLPLENEPNAAKASVAPTGSGGSDRGLGAILGIKFDGRTATLSRTGTPIPSEIEPDTVPIAAVTLATP
jgi:hypothetical protein